MSLLLIRLLDVFLDNSDQKRMLIKFFRMLFKATKTGILEMKVTKIKERKH